MVRGIILPVLVPLVVDHNWSRDYSIDALFTFIYLDLYLYWKHENMENHNSGASSILAPLRMDHHNSVHEVLKQFIWTLFSNLNPLNQGEWRSKKLIYDDQRTWLNVFHDVVPARKEEPRMKLYTFVKTECFR